MQLWFERERPSLRGDPFPNLLRPIRLSQSRKGQENQPVLLLHQAQ